MPRFVILDHDFPSRHWDFLLETGAQLRGWRLWAEPALGRDIPAEPTPDHRPVYLTYEGDVSGDRGTVIRWDAGTFDWRRDETEVVEVELRGVKLRGRAQLSRGVSGLVWRCDQSDAAG